MACAIMNGIPEDFLSKSMRVEALLLSNLRCAAQHMRTVVREDLLFDLERYAIVQKELLGGQQALLDARVRPELARHARAEYDRLIREYPPPPPPCQSTSRSRRDARRREEARSSDTASQTDSTLLPP